MKEPEIYQTWTRIEGLGKSKNLSLEVDLYFFLDLNEIQITKTKVTDAYSIKKSIKRDRFPILFENIDDTILSMVEKNKRYINLCDAALSNILKT